jgi:hypothetical protein
MKSFIQLKQELLESGYLDKMSRVAGIAQHRFGPASDRTIRIVNRINRRVAVLDELSAKGWKNVATGAKVADAASTALTIGSLIAAPFTGGLSLAGLGAAAAIKGATKVATTAAARGATKMASKMASKQASKLAVQKAAQSTGQSTLKRKALGAGKQLGKDVATGAAMQGGMSAVTPKPKSSESDVPESDVQETIARRGNRWVVMNRNETKVLGVHGSKEKAQRQLTAIEINKQKRGFGENVSYLGKKPSLTARNTLLGKILRKTAGWEASMASDEEGHRQKEFDDQYKRLKKLHDLLKKRKKQNAS